MIWCGEQRPITFDIKIPGTSRSPSKGLSVLVFDTRGYIALCGTLAGKDVPLGGMQRYTNNSRPSYEYGV